MDPGEQITGTRDEHYNLVSVLYHALEGAETCDTYAIDAEATGDERLAVFFREAQEMQVGLAERAKMLLGIIEAPPEPTVAPDIAQDVPPEVPPEGAVTPGTVSGGMPLGPEVPTGEAPLAADAAPGGANGATGCRGHDPGGGDGRATDEHSRRSPADDRTGEGTIADLGLTRFRGPIRVQ